MSDILENDPLYARAQEMIEEALSPWVGKLPPETIKVMRLKLEVDLLVDPNGREALRKTLDDDPSEQELDGEG